MSRKSPTHRNGHEVIPQFVENSFAFNFRPRNAVQRDALELFSTCDVLGLIGPAGTGKSVLAVALALSEILHKRAERLTLIRPCVEAAEHALGWLGGGLDEKLDPHYAGFSEAIHRVAFGFPGKLMRRLAISFLRSMTFTSEVAVLDEAQNCTLAELKLVLTRLGEGAKLIIVGDPEQVDIKRSGLEEFFQRLDGAPGIVRLDFSERDIVRHPRMGGWLQRLR